MSKFVCLVCGYVFDEADGVSWEQLPDDWVCPVCGAAKSEFSRQAEKAAAARPKVAEYPVEFDDIRELTALELSALCSNLARGCEKQYMARESELFRQISDYFKAASAPAEDASYQKLMRLVENDLNAGFPAASAVCRLAKDRGALRALTWSEKVTRVLKSLLARYEREGEAMLQNTGVFVCTICGFIAIGDRPPEICPVCKVPGYKFEKIEGRAV